jgi:hypothetical protein
MDTICDHYGNHVSSLPSSTRLNVSSRIHINNMSENSSELLASDNDEMRMDPEASLDGNDYQI